MKKIVSMVLCTLLILAGCTSRGNVTVAQETPEATPHTSGAPSPSVEVSAGAVSPTATPQTEPVAYAIEGLTIVREQGSSKTAIYDVTEWFPDGWDCWLDDLAVQPEALYFTEGGQPKDSDFTESKYAVVRIGLDGTDRRVLHTVEAVGYLQLVPYGEKIFFVQDGMDSTQIGWVLRDGSQSDWLHITEYAAQYNMLPWYSCLTLYVKDGVLCADMMFLGDPDLEEEEHTVCIGEDLTLTRMDA